MIKFALYSDPIEIPHLITSGFYSYSGVPILFHGTKHGGIESFESITSHAGYRTNGSDPAS